MVSELEQNILDYVESEGSATCVALSQLFGCGDNLIIGEDKVVYAFGLSDEVSEALVNLVGSGQLVDLNCSVVRYEFDGGVPEGIPCVSDLAEEDRNGTYWIPILYITYDELIRSAPSVVEDEEMKDMINNTIAVVNERRANAGVV
jgi:hypothetical protein